jgi:hypothetical protein
MYGGLILKYYKKLMFFAVMAILVAVTFINGIYADIIYVPDGNSFYLTHSSECPYHGRSYTANDPSGVIHAYNAPDGKSEKASYPNGTQFFITHIYTDADGVVWGISAEGHLADSGWIQMNYLSLIYDYISFAEEHGSEFIAFDAGKYQLPSSGEVKFWKYPDSGIVVCKFDASKLGENLNISKVYVSPDGRVWGFVKYIMGAKNVWVCLDDKGSEPETTENKTYVDAGVATGYPYETGVPLAINPGNSWIISVTAAAVLAAAAGVMIIIYYERKKK